jgi:type II secretory pathway pseudopilin PulG
MPVRSVELSRISERRGFTILEALLAVLVIGIMIAVALPLYLNSVSESAKQTCRGNLQYISTCVESARLKSTAVDYTEIIAGGINTANLPRLTQVPVCPAGGIYSLAMGSSGDATTFKVQCSIPTHGAFQPGIDTN